jgi:hypothetical protein
MNEQFNSIKIHGINDVKLDMWNLACPSASYLSRKIEWLATGWTFMVGFSAGAGHLQSGSVTHSPPSQRQWVLCTGGKIVRSPKVTTN